MALWHNNEREIPAWFSVFKDVPSKYLERSSEEVFPPLDPSWIAATLRALVDRMLLELDEHSKGW